MVTLEEIDKRIQNLEQHPCKHCVAYELRVFKEMRKKWVADAAEQKSKSKIAKSK